MEPDIEFKYPNVIDFFGTTLCHICHFTTHDLLNYSDYDKYAEGNIQKSNSDVDKQISLLLKENDDSDHDEIICSFSTEFQEFCDIYPAIHRKSMVIALYNFFEHQIKTLCIEVNRLLPADKSAMYFRDACIKSYRRFLRREAGFDMKPGDILWEVWEDMLKVEQIRHVLVHSEGEIEENRVDRHADIESYCKRKKSIRLYRYRILIDNVHVATLISDLITLFEKLAKHVQAFIRRYENEHGRYDIALPTGASKIPL
ncbi:hypothetical protein AB9Q52_000780 (plasmid) [Pantoea vagans]|uniref:hypothetical protein n=1 Tax=Pantoea vagans TaxID=470934 RepID=UPI0035137388